MTKLFKTLNRPAGNEEYTKAILDACQENHIRVRKTQPPNKLAKARKAVGPEFDRAWHWVDDVLKKRRLDKIAPIIETAVTKANAEAVTTRANKIIAKAKASIAESKEIQRRALAKSNDAKTQVKRQHAEFEQELAEIAKGVETCVANAERGAAQVARAQVSNAARVIQRHNNELAEWQAKAAATNDPILKAGYLERVEAIKEGIQIDE